MIIQAFEKLIVLISETCEIAARVEQSSNNLEQYKQGFTECIAEMLQFLGQGEGYYSGDDFCNRLVNHLQNHCDKIVHGKRFSLCWNSPATFISFSFLNQYLTQRNLKKKKIESGYKTKQQQKKKWMELRRMSPLHSLCETIAMFLRLYNSFMKDPVSFNLIKLFFFFFNYFVK